jgi:hypothetical protein
MVFTFARVSAACGLNVADIFHQQRRLWVRLHEKGGKFHEMPCHHTLAHIAGSNVLAQIKRHMGSDVRVVVISVYAGHGFRRACHGCPGPRSPYDPSLGSRFPLRPGSLLRMGATVVCHAVVGGDGEMFSGVIPSRGVIMSMG